MKRIMIVDENQVVGYTGGAEKIICEMSNALSRNYKISIVCMNKESGRPWIELRECVDFFNLAHEQEGNPFIGWKWHYKRLERELLRAIGGKKLRIGKKQFTDPKKAYIEKTFVKRLSYKIDEWQPDVIVAIDAISANISLQAMRGNLIPVISMYHGNPIDIQEDVDIIRNIWTQCAVVQVLQDRFCTILHSWGIKDVVAIPNPVFQTSSKYLSERRAYLDSQERKRIVTVGRIEGSGKRQHLLIEAFAGLVDKYPDWDLYIYGAADNPRYGRKCRELVANMKLSSRIVFAGTTRDIFAVYKQAEIFAFPSRIEGFGLALVEAMSAGLPVIVYGECYPDDTIVKNDVTGIKCDEGISPLAKALDTLMADQNKRLKMGNAGHDHTKKFSPNNVWDAWKKLIEEVINV